MKLSAPIHKLKRDARRLSRQDAVPLMTALDCVASQEGYASWSLLAARHAALSPAQKLYAQLAAGELVLLAARPGQGKTLMAFALAAEATRAGHNATIFTLEDTPEQVRERLRSVGYEHTMPGGGLSFDCSDAICADYIVAQMQAAAPGDLVVVDYLQLLDQRRNTPPLAEQVATLHAFAGARGVIVVFVAQVIRAYEDTGRRFPELADLRLPNPIDVSLFSRAGFLANSQLRISALT